MEVLKLDYSRVLMFKPTFSTLGNYITLETHIWIKHFTETGLIICITYAKTLVDHLLSYDTLVLAVILFILASQTAVFYIKKHSAGQNYLLVDISSFSALIRCFLVDFRSCKNGAKVSENQYHIRRTVHCYSHGLKRTLASEITPQMHLDIAVLCIIVSI